MACKLCRIIVYHKHPRYKFFSFLHHPGILMVEGQEAQDTWTSTSCRSKLQRGCQREDKELLPCSQLCHQGKHQWMMAIATVWPDSSWGFPESCAANDSESKHSSGGNLSREVYLDNANRFAAVFLRETQGSSPSPTLPFVTHAP